MYLDSNIVRGIFMRKKGGIKKVLLLFSALGGSVAMFITMLIIRHKTKHVKFMLGIPIIMIVQIAIAVACILII